MNKQRETIYGLRRQLMEEPDQREYLVGDTGVARDLLADTTKQYLNPDASEDDWDIENYKVKIHSIYAFDPTPKEWTSSRPARKRSTNRSGRS